MWLYLVTVVLFAFGAAAGLAGIGPVAILLVILGVLALGAKMSGRLGGGSEQPSPSGQTMASTGGTPKGTPQDDETLGKAHVKTGAAHAGQERMTPETMEGEKQSTEPSRG